MKTEVMMWAIVAKSGLGHLDEVGMATLLRSRDEARALKRPSETVKRVKVTIENA